MEPAAPGTEDDAIQPTISKKASDDERLLAIKAHLPSGRYGNVFTKSYFDGMEQWYCNICECPVMGRMFHHETGKRHTQQIAKMEQRQPRTNKGFSAKDAHTVEAKPDEDEEDPPFSKMGSGLDSAKITVAPGEPVPPGVDGDATKVAQIQSRLDKFKASALLGLEYLLEITDYDVHKEPSYLCALCDKKGDPRTVIAHLVSYNHLQQFMQRHFPATYRALSPYITRQYRKNWQDTMNSIAEAIETKYGRLLPHPVDKDVFEKRRDFYYQMIHMGPHFSEKNGVTFEQMVKPEEIVKNIEEDPTVAGQSMSALEDKAKKRSPSPPVVAKPKRVRSNAENIRGRRNSLSSVSSISSNELNDSGTGGGEKAGKDGTNSGGRGGARGRDTKSSGGSRRRLSGSKSMSISPENETSTTAGAAGARKSRSRSRSRTRYQNTYNPRYNHAQRGSYRGGTQSNRGARYNSNYRRSRSPRSRSPNRNTDRRSRSRSPRSNDRRPPWERSNYSNRSFNRSPPSAGRGGEAGRMERTRIERESKVEEYNRLSKAIENDMSRVLKGHEKNPEKHPQYNEEWKLFWNKRYKELQVEGKDAANYDFKPEWIIVWNKRMMEIHNSDVKVKKEALRRRLGLRDEVAPISFRIGKHSPNSKGPAPVAAQPDQDHEVIIIDDKDDEMPPSGVKTATPDRSHSPWETDIPAAIGAAKKMAAEDAGAPKKTVTGKTEKGPEKSLSRSRDDLTRANRRPSPDYPGRRSRTSRDRDRSLERSLDRELHRKRSPLNNRDRDMRSGGGGGEGGGAGLAHRGERERVISLDRDSRNSRDRDRRMAGYDVKGGARYDSRERDGRRSRGEEGGGGSAPNWERDKRGGLTDGGGKSRSPASQDRDRYYRERDRDYFERERSWERVINQHREMRNTMAPSMPDVYRPPMIMRDVTSAPMHYMPPGMMPMQQRPPSPEIDIPDEDVSIVSVLRLLTALEETLGSLGPKVIDLLASSLAMEKNEPNSSEMLLDNEINCVMFETVKEKLKGRFQAGLVTYKQEKAVKHAIKGLATLIHQASERKRIRVQQAALNPLTVPGVGVVDKAAIAKQIATALVLQGKTDVTQGELEQLINAVVGMAEASKNSETPMNTAMFLTQYREKTPEFTPKIIIPTVQKEKLKLEQAAAAAKTVPSEESTPTAAVANIVEESNSMEGLSDSDLQTLLQNFKDLSTEEQHGLISYLKKLEAREPQRVEKLRQFVNMSKSESDQLIKTATDDFEPSKKFDNVHKFVDSDEEEDYSYEDVFKAAKQNVTKKEQEDEEEKARKKAEREEADKKNMEINLDQAKLIIANLMGTISKATAAANAKPSQQQTNSDLLGLINSALEVDDIDVEQKSKIRVKDPSVLVQSNIVIKEPEANPTLEGARMIFEPPQQDQFNNSRAGPQFTQSNINAGLNLSQQQQNLMINPNSQMMSLMNRLDFRPQQQVSAGVGGGGGSGGGLLPPPPPQPPQAARLLFPGGNNPFGMISYPAPNLSNRSFVAGDQQQQQQQSMRFGGAFNPFGDGGVRGGFGSNDAQQRGLQQQQQQPQQRGDYNNSNRW